VRLCFPGGEAEVDGGVGDGGQEDPGRRRDGREAAGETPQRHGCGGRTVAQRSNSGRNLSDRRFVNVERKRSLLIRLLVPTTIIRN
jgi:hypothetical protein